MKSEQKLRDFTLRLIQIIVWFEILWAVVFLAGMVFQWSGLTDQLAVAFFGSGFCAVLVLAALTLLNVTANLTKPATNSIALLNNAETRGDAEFLRCSSVTASLAKELGAAAGGIPRDAAFQA